MNNARPITISDNEKVINTKRRISAKTWNQDYTRMSGFLRYKGIDIRAYSDDGQTWRANADDTLIKIY